MPWWAYFLAGTPLAGTLAYGQWLGKRTLKNGRDIALLDAGLQADARLRDAHSRLLEKMGDKLDNLSDAVAGLSAQMKILIDG